MNDTFADRLLRWFDQHGRRDLPWQRRTGSASDDAYRVWLSEVMLQQTQVSTVRGYFERFITALPTLRDVAAAEEDQVFALWSGLGYYRRARFLHQAAQICVARHGGELPADFAALSALPGIGRSTAGAILAQAWGQHWPILDANVQRVLARYHGVPGYPGQTAVHKQLWLHAQANTPIARVADYTQAIMDLGATVCLSRAPLCVHCPLASNCIAYRDNLTGELPARKPARVSPTRVTLMLVLRDRGQRVLLERRGAAGVWSGLWSLPEASDSDSALRLAGRYAQLGDAQALNAFTHVFTHYRLHISPLLFDRVRAHHAVADNPQLHWYAADELLALGLPAPVRRLLLQINDSASPCAAK